MRSGNTAFLLRTLAFSALAGMRSVSPPALLSLYLARYPASAEHSAAQRLRSTAAQATLVTLALGELAADKFPNAPNRTFLPALIGRAFTGGGVSGVLWSLHGRPAWIGGVLGAVASIANTYATFHLRGWLSRTLPIPNAVSWAGMLEDAVVWLGGWWLLNSLTDEVTDEGA